MSNPEWWRVLEPNWPVIGFMTLAFILGRMNFTFLILPMLIWYISKLENGWREKAVNREVYEKLAEEESRRADIRETSESCKWVNNALKVLFPRMSHTLATSTFSFLIRALANINAQKDKTVKLEVKAVNFGDVSPILEGISSMKPVSPYEYRVQGHLLYCGPATIEMEAQVASLVSVPIILSELEIKGNKPPIINFAIRTLARLDIMDLPSLKSTISNAVTAYLKSSMVAPNAFRMDFSPQAQKPTTEDIKTAVKYQVVSALDDYDEIGTTLSSSSRDSIERSSSSLTASASITQTETSTGSNFTIITPNSSSQVTPSAPGASQSAELVSAPSISASTLTSATTTEPTVTPNSLEAAIASHISYSSSLSAPSQPFISASTRAASATSPSRSQQQIPLPSNQVSSSTNHVGSSVPRATKQPKKNEEDMNEFLLMSSEEVSGTLRVQVIECQRLPSTDLFGINPYVTLEVNGVRHATEVMKHTSNPVWRNAIFEFPIPKTASFDSLKMKVQVLDKERFGSDNLLAELKIRLQECLEHPDRKFPISAALSNVSGAVKLICQYVTD